MKNKGTARMVLSILVSVLLVFGIIGTAVLCFACSAADSPDYLKGRLEKCGTAGSVYNDLMKKYDELSVQTSVPADVYKSAVSERWVSDAVFSQVDYIFALMEDENAQPSADYSAFDEKITEYFEQYAAEKHVIKDDIYNQRLQASVDNARSVTASVIDVFHFETVRKTSLWPATVKYRPLLNTLRTYAFIADAVLLVLLIVFGSPVYWTGVSLFSAGLISAAPSAYVLASGLIMKFTIKDYTVFTLITETLKSIVNSALVFGSVSLIAGVILITVSVIYVRKLNK
ncbi:MAG: hypothetical protein Q4D76_12950 [Oscillospiraceae bacterium]|nr:hypothetical protein [Oscillospiraceae bacterium]